MLILFDTLIAGNALFQAKEERFEGMQSRRSPSPVSVHTPPYSKIPLDYTVIGSKSSTKVLPSTANLKEIESNISKELWRIKCHPEFSRQERFLVYKHAFDQVVEDKAVVYKYLLSQIKAEYEDCIQTLERGQNQGVYLQGLLKALLSEKANVRHFVQRGDELEEKIRKLRKHNKQLKGKIHALKSARAERLASAESKSLHSAVKETRFLIPGLSLRDLTDLRSLRRTSVRLDAQVRELKDATTTMFVEKSQKSALKQQLTEKEGIREHVLSSHEKLQDRCETLKVAVEVR